jgi:hypothetical protein
MEQKICNLERLSSLEINLARLDKDSSMKPTSMEIVLRWVTLQKRFRFLPGPKGTGVHYEVSTLWELPVFFGSTHELSLKPGASRTTYCYVDVTFGVYECGSLATL